MDEQVDDKRDLAVPYRAAKGYRLVTTCPHCKRELEIEQVRIEPKKEIGTIDVGEYYKD